MIFIFFKCKCPGCMFMKGMLLGGALCGFGYILGKVLKWAMFL
jgi:hypothetical protein